MYSGATKYRYLGYIWISKPLMPNLSLTALALDEGFQKTSTDANGSSTYGNKVSMYHRYTARITSYNVCYTKLLRNALAM